MSVTFSALFLPNHTSFENQILSHPQWRPAYTAFCRKLLQTEGVGAYEAAATFTSPLAEGVRVLFLDTSQLVALVRYSQHERTLIIASFIAVRPGEDQKRLMRQYIQSFVSLHQPVIQGESFVPISYFDWGLLQ